MKFKITNISRKYIVIKTETAFSDNGIDLRTNKTKFKIYLEKELKLTTPTTDQGDIYYMTLIK